MAGPFIRFSRKRCFKKANRGTEATRVVRAYSHASLYSFLFFHIFNMLIRGKLGISWAKLQIEGLSNISQCIDRICRVTPNHSNSRPQHRSLHGFTTLSCGHLHFLEGSSRSESDRSPVCPSGGAGGPPQANSRKRAGYRYAAPSDSPPAGALTARHGLRYQIHVCMSNLRCSRAVAG